MCVMLKLLVWVPKKINILKVCPEDNSLKLILRITCSLLKNLIIRDQNLTCPLQKKAEQLSYLYKLHTCVDPDVVLVICRTGESPPAALLITDIGSLPSVRTDMYFPYVGGGERSLTPLKGALKGTLTWNVPEEIAKHYIFLPDNTFTSIKPSNIDQT